MANSFLHYERFLLKSSRIMSKKKVKDWTDNALLFYHSKKVGRCPHCNSDDISVEELDIGRYSITFVCNNCGSGAHFDGCYGS